MFVELTREEVQLLAELVRVRLCEVRDDARQTESEQSDEQLQASLQDDLRRLARLEHRLHEAEWDVTC